ncbi:anaphase-promoting complex subunit 11 [Pavlovales sp. CCMP2436]|nr:anaphase-promoting complex subunit 11 [Pavlovales sp. CCMP2436]
MSRLKVTVKRWSAVASWTWAADDDVCGICHMALDGRLYDFCQGPGDDSPVVWGKCAHNFHLLCISTWLNNSKNSCPICRRNWEFAPSAPPPPGDNAADED